MAGRKQLYGNVARYLANPPTLVDGDYVPLLVDENGALIISTQQLILFLSSLPGATTPGHVLTVNSEGDGFEFVAP